MKKTLMYAASLVALSLGATACQSDHQDVVEERTEARKEINDAKQDLAEQKVKNTENISEAAREGDPIEVEKEKIKATEKLADAERKVDEEKVEATEEITEAEKAAGESTGTLRQE